MDFFDHQDKARKRTRFLLVYFVLAILGIALSVYVVVSIAIAAMDTDRTALLGAPFKAFRWEIFAGSTMGTLVVVLLSTGFKSMQLHGGGKVVARELGGRRIDSQTTQPQERRLLNIVEEMAIASGVPVPDVYVMEDEHTVNAFAAGRTVSDAVVGVTRGCMNMLTRDELQAVIAHEFSHILNGDMRLNMRLMAFIFGITVLTVIGRILARISSESREKGALPIIAVGVALIIIGFLGVFFGRLIQKAVSRQREFLADASAVQFTRNPDGMTGALKKIGAMGSRVDDPHAEEVGHMMIASAFSDEKGSIFSTHPPLGARIRAIDPNWNGSYDDVRFPQWNTQADSSEQKKGGDGQDFDFLQSVVAISAAEAVQQAGQQHQQHLRQGQAILHHLPQDWLAMAHDQVGAQALVYGMLLPESGEHDNALFDQADADVAVRARKLRSDLSALHSSVKIALIDLAISSLRRLSPTDYERFRETTDRLVHRDGQVDLFEFTLQKMLKRHLGIHFHETKPAKIRYRHWSGLRDELGICLAALARVSSDDASERLNAFEKGAAPLISELKGEELVFSDEIDLPAIDEALNRLDAATPLMKKQWVYAAAQVVWHDEEVTSDEAELFRAIADTIGVPVPPFISQAGEV